MFNLQKNVYAYVYIFLAPCSAGLAVCRLYSKLSCFL